MTTPTPTPAKQPKGILNLILSEHAQMREMYQTLLNTRDPARLRSLVTEYVRFISQHGHKEEIAFYPNIMQYLDKGKHTVEHSLKEHRDLDRELKKLEQLEYNDADYKQLIAQIEKTCKPLLHHLEEEENDMLHPLREKLSAEMQEKLAHQFEAAGAIASQHPHPELTTKAEKAPQEAKRVGLEEKEEKINRMNKTRVEDNDVNMSEYKVRF